jgi:hypothetical protein
MSLLKKRTMTERQKASARENGRRSRGPATREGREQIRAANLRHGLFSQAQEIVLPELGEDAEDFEKLRQACSEEWPGADPAQVESLAAAWWRLERTDRRLEELDIALARGLAGEAADSPNAFDPHARLRALMEEGCAMRDFFRISNRLLKASMEREHATTGLLQKIVKTKKEESEVDVNSAGKRTRAGVDGRPEAGPPK